jgi:hypothetical protein
LDLLKIAVFVAAFVLLVVIGRILSAHAERYPAPPLEPAQPDGAAGARDFMVHQGGRRPAMTGEELGFPIAIPPVKADNAGKYNRPFFKNYYFHKTDLVAGPPDPTSFCDELFLDAQHPEGAIRWTYRYTVATPNGLQQVMNEESYASLYFDVPVIVVSRWDLAVILSTVVEEIMKDYSEAGFQESAKDVPTTE